MMEVDSISSSSNSVYDEPIEELDQPQVFAEGWDRTLLDIASKAAEPLCWAYELLRYRLVAPLDTTKFNNCQTIAGEVATRALIVAGAIFSVPLLVPALLLGAANKGLRAVGFALQKNNFTYVKGQAPEKELDGKAKVLTWNLCAIGGGMHYDHGGVNPFRTRVEDLVDKILTEDPDVLVLQEIYDINYAEDLIKKLGPHYANFFVHLGANVIGSVGGVMVITKCAVHSFTNTPFDNNDWSLNRTFTQLEIKAKPTDTRPSARIIGTHLIHNDSAKRMEQVAQIINSLAQQNHILPTVIAGDLNMERDSIIEGEFLNRYLIHSYLSSQPTCTNQLTHHWDPSTPAKPDETIDYISLVKKTTPDGRVLPVDDTVQIENARIVSAFDETYDTRTALSDHHGLVTTLHFK